MRGLKLFHASSVPWRLGLLWLLCPVIVVADTAYSRYFFFCSLAQQTVIDVNITVLSDGTLSFVKIDLNDTDNDNNIDEGDVGGPKRSLRRAAEQLRRRNEERQEEFERARTFFNDGDDEEEDAIPAIRLTSGKENPSDLLPGTSQIIQVRECHCSPQMEYLPHDFFCPMERTYCAIPGSYYTHPQDPVCLNVQNDEVFVRSIWPIILIWFALSGVFCMFTWSGRNASDYLISCCFPGWNEAIFDAVVYGNWAQERQEQQQEGAGGQRRNSSWWHRLAIHRREQFQCRYRGIVGRARWAEDAVSPNNREFEIRARIYKSEEHQHEPSSSQRENRTLAVTTSDHKLSSKDEENGLEAGDHDEEHDDHTPSCSICFLPLEDGDRVGALECKHVFHVKCLKGWLARRNVCPLCLQGDIAKPKGQHQMQRRNPASAGQQQPPQQSQSRNNAAGRR